MKRIIFLISMLLTYSCVSGDNNVPKLIIQSKKDPGLYGIIDGRGKILLKPIYKSIRALENDTFLISDPVNGDMLLDNTGVLKKVEGNSFEPSFVTVNGLRENEPDNRWVYDYLGNPLFQLPNGLYINRLYCNGLYIVEKERTHLSGYIDSKGEIIIDCIYDSVSLFNSGIATVEKDKESFFIDLNGNIIIHGKWEDISSFSENMAPVFNGKKWGFINTKGELVIDFQYDEVTSFSDGLSRVLIGTGYPYDEDSHFYFIDKTGKVVIDCHKNGWIDVDLFSAGFAAVQRKDQRWIFIDKKGQQAFDGDFAYAFSFENTACYQEKRYLESTEAGRQILARRPAYARVVLNKTWDTDDLGSLSGDELLNIESRPVYIDTSGKIISDYFR